MASRLLLLSCILPLTALIFGLLFVELARVGVTRHLISQRQNAIRNQHSSCHKGIDSPEEWVPPLTPDALQNAYQDNPALIKHICEDWLLPPFTGERRLAHPEKEHYSQRGQSQFIDSLLKQKTNGFFVECGAANGEQLSNSLFFEKSRNWTGLLVEANPSSFSSLLQKRRHCHMVNACLSPSTKSRVLPFTLAEMIGGLVDYMEDTHKERIRREFPDSALTVNVQCFPLYSMLKAMNVVQIDYFSLDVEGAELEVLYTIPLDQISIDIFSIEYVVSDNEQATREKLKDIIKYLVTTHGYQVMQFNEGEDVILKKA